MSKSGTATAAASVTAKPKGHPHPTPTPTPTPTPSKTKKPRNGAKAVENEPKVSLCVEVARSQSVSARGQAAQWLINAWTTGGNVPDAIIRLQSTPTTGKAVFSFGCGTYDGTASCDLGAMDSKSRTRQLQATLTVPAGETGVQAETLTVIGSAAKLPRDPAASSTVTLTTPVTPAEPDPVTSPLSVGSLPDIPAPSPTLSPGGNAAALFPTLRPSAASAAAGRGAAASKANVNKLADTAALPEGAPVIGAQLIGLGALALAFVLAVTRLSIRRRPNVAPLSAAPPAAPAPADTPPAEPPPAEPQANPGLAAELPVASDEVAGDGQEE